MLQTLLFLTLFHPPTKILTWDAFKGTAPMNTEWGAEIVTNLTIVYAEGDFKGHYYYVAASIDSSQSWTKRYDSIALKHEQVHYAITVIMQRRINQSLEPYQNTYMDKEATKVYEKLIKKWKHYQQNYDAESFHGKNVAGQKKWERWVEKELNQQ